MKLSICILLILVASFGNSQHFLQSFGGINHDESLSLGMDAEGKLYHTGFFNNTLNFESSSVVSNGNSDVYVARNDTIGEPEWIFSGGSTGPDRGLDMAVMPDGTTLITGFHSHNANFDGTTLPSNSLSQDLIVLKLSPSGDMVWVRTFGGELGDTGYGIDADPSGNVVVTGQFRGTIDFDGTTFTSTTHQDGGLSADVFVLKLDSDGNVLWAKQGQNDQDSKGLDVKFDNAGNVVACGQFSDTLTFDQTHLNDVYNAGFVIKFDENGNEQWFRKITSSQTIANALEINSDNQIYVTGDNIGPVAVYNETDPQLFPVEYSYNIFLSKFGPNGALVWLTTNGSENQISSKEIALDNVETPYITGTFNCRFDEYSEEYGEGIFFSAGWRDIFISRFDVSGNRMWSRHMASNQDDYCSAIAVNIPDMPVISGSFENEFVVTYADSFVDNAGNWLEYVGGSYCGDNNYGTLILVSSEGNKDIFLTAPIDLNREPLDYFIRPGGDCNRPYRPACVNLCNDSIISCGPTSTGIIDYTSGLGPEYEWTWSSPDYSPLVNMEIPVTGTYYMTYERSDGCMSFADTLHAVIHPIPLPLISDDIVVNNLIEPNAIPLSFCHPDTVLLMGSNFNSSDDFEWSSSQGFISTEADSAIRITDTGNYTFTITNEFGCSETNNISVVAFSPIDSVPMYLRFPEFEEPTDTVYMCEDDNIEVELYTTGDVSVFYDILDNSDISWTITPEANANIWSPSLGTDFAIIDDPQTGFFTISVHIEGLCDSAALVVERSVYIVVYPDPFLNISLVGDDEICPGDSTILTAYGTNFYNWGGDNFIQTGNNTIMVWEPGTYSAQASITNEFGCSASSSDWINVGYRDPPEIQMFPENGLVCPNDSVLLSTEAGLDFIWYGPQGQLSQNVQSIWVHDPGAYFCVVTDLEGCTMESNFVDVIEYATPYLITNPTNDLCFTGSVNIEVITYPFANFQWQPPLFSNSQTVTVYNPGQYTCEVTLCGITTTQSITVIETEVNAQIGIESYPTVCNGDSVLLTGNPGMSEYEWFPNGETNPEIWVTEPGEYILYTSDAQGCQGESEPVQISDTPSVQISDLDYNYICPEDSLLLTTVDGYDSYSWSPTNDTLGSIWVLEPGNYQVTATDENGCTGISESITLLPGSTPASPELEDELICAGNNLSISATINGDLVWITPDDEITANPLTITNLQSDTTLFYYVFGTNGCSGATDSLFVQVIPDFYQPEILGDSTVCFGDSLILLTEIVPEGTYQWFVNNVPLSNNPELVLSGDLTSTDLANVSLTVNVADCASGTASLDLNILPLPPDITINGVPDVCDGDTVMLYAESPDSVNVSWNWENQEHYNDTLWISQTSDSVSVWMTSEMNGCYNLPVQQWVNFHQHPLIENIVTNSPVCAGELLTLSAVSSTGSSVTIVTPLGSTYSSGSMQLFPSDTSDTGEYFVNASTQFCTTSDSVWLVVNPIPDIDLGNDSIFCSGGDAYFEITGYEMVFWNDSILSNFYQTNTEEIIYVEVINEFGCATKDEVHISFEACDGILSNVFTPNNDGTNDYFFFNPYGFKDIRVTIYNRWGKVVCELVDLDFWDGIHCKSRIPVSDGTYFYIVEYATRENIPGTKKGYIQVFR